MDAYLFQHDDPVTRTRLYLHILYAKDYLDRARELASGMEIVPELTKQLLTSIDFELMELEQAARARNLRRHILRAAPSLEYGLEENLLGQLVDRFTNSEEFWIPAGRSLTENFCFFVHQHEAENLTNFQKDTVKACGVISGISVSSLLESPWIAKGETSMFEQADEEICETFISSFTLLDGVGELVTQANASIVKQEASSRIFVRRLRDFRVFVNSVSLT